MDSAWLKATLRSRRVTQRSLGDAIGLSQDKINKALAHVRLFSPIEAIKIADFLEKYQVDRSETLRAILGKDAALLDRGANERAGAAYAPPPLPERRIPVIGVVSAVGAVTYFGAGATQEYAETILLSNKTESLVALRVQEKGSYSQGDIIYFDDHGQIDQSAMEKEAVVELRDGSRFVRTPKYGSVPGSYTLEATQHAPAMENVLLKSASRVLLVKKA